MDTIRALILGVVEGLTEFLPISSTGHLIIVGDLLGVQADEAPWSLLLWVSQLAAILAVIVLFGGDLRRRVFAPIAGGWRRHLLTKLAVAMLPTVVLALLFKKWLDPLETPVPTAIALIVGAIVMEWIDRRYRREAAMDLDDITLRQAFWIGAIQALSMVPGVSRAGATIMGGMALGLTPRVAAQFSFYLAIPTMFAAAVKTLLDHSFEMTSQQAGLLLVGCATAFTTALLVVAGFLEFVKRYRFTAFAVYRVVLGVAVLLWAWRG
ncbi:MAG: undecaprenyl-diphosphate phosphatase [Phycisphaerales bacterium]|nr:undecaprenyl-diphosphate phosphatase [Phycisphaerales bacterium]